LADGLESPTTQRASCTEDELLDDELLDDELLDEAELCELAELAVLADVGQLDHEDVLGDEALEVRASVLDELTLDAELGEERL